jgi:PPM family protein phosphatase
LGFILNHNQVFVDGDAMYEIGSATDVGIKRRGKENQDSMKVVLPGLSNRKPPLLIVADGMGGYEGGVIASQLVIETLGNSYLTADTNEIGYLDILYDGILSAHQAIRMKAKENEVFSQMGSTVVAMVLDENMAYVANVGDSHAYIINEEKIEQINWDHSLVADELRVGNITRDEVRNYPRKNVLTMSINAKRDEIEPYTASYHLEKDDVILLCSDGLWGPVSESQIQAVALELDPQRAADKLVEMANANQGPDNITVIIARKTKKYSTTEDTWKKIDTEETRPTIEPDSPKP